MAKNKILKTDVCCNVCCCVHNVDGCLCNKKAIEISQDGQMENAHFCKSFECKE